MSDIFAAGRLAGLDEVQLGGADSNSPAVTALASGGFVATWTAGNFIRAQVFDRHGIALAPAFNTTPLTFGSRGYPAVAALSNGGFVITWQDSWSGTADTSGESIRARVFDAAGTPTTGEFLVNTTTFASQSQPSVTGLATGGFVIAWTDQNGDSHGSGIRAQAYAASGTPLGGEFLVNTTTQVGEQHYPLLASLPDGGFIASWIGFGDFKAQLFNANREPTGGEITIAGDSNWAHALAPIGSGNFIIVRADAGDLYAQVYNSAGAVVGGSFRVNTTVANMETAPTVTMLSSGNFMISWRDASPSGNFIDQGDVRAQLFDSSGAKLGAEFIVHAAIPGSQSDPQLAGFGTDDVVALWLNYAGSSSATLQSRLFFSTIMGTELADTLDGTGERDFIYGLGGDDALTGGDGDDELDGGDGDDVLIGGAGNDTLYGRGGNDLIDSGTGLDRADGGDGIDGITADLRGLSSSLYWSLNFRFQHFLYPTLSFENFEYFKSLKTGGGNDVITTRALALDDTIEAGGGDDDIWVFNGNDTVNGESGNDILRISYGDFVSTPVTTSGFANWASGGYTGTVSTAGRSVLFGGIERFEIATGSGNDVIRTGAGNDTVWVNDGDDFVDVGSGFDSAHGGDGIDGLSADLSAYTQQIVLDFVTGTFVVGNISPSVVFSGFEYIGTLVTGSGNDFVITNALGKDETAITGLGNDFVSVANGHDQADGGAGTDFLEVDYRTATAAVVVSAFSGSLAAGYSGSVTSADRGVTFSGFERFRILGGSANDTLNGGDSIDLLDGGAGADTMAGGLGNDTYVVDDAGDVVTENASGGSDRVWTTLAVYELPANVEALTAIGATAARIFRDNALDNVITGGEESDFVFLQAGGTDRVLGLGGGDTFLFGSTFTAADFADGGSGYDTLALQGNYTLTFGTGLVSNLAGIENIGLLSGVNTRFGEPGANRYSYDLTMLDSNVAAGQVLRVNGANLVAGENFTFNGSAETDGGFVVYGGLGTDVFTGGKQSDVFFFGDSLSYAPGDIANGGEGYDGLFFRGDYTIDFTQPGYAGGLISIENITLSSASDERHQRGGDGEFDYHITFADDVVAGGVTMTVNGSLLMANETMWFDGSLESDAHFRLFAGASDDTMAGGSGNDLLYGGLGADQLAGHGGADTFRYDETADSNAAATDKIYDFTPGTDKIDLTRVDADSVAAGDQAFRFIGTSAFSGQGAASAGELHTRFAGGLWYVEGDVDGDGTADLIISMATPADAAPTAADFFL